MWYFLDAASRPRLPSLESHVTRSRTARRGATVSTTQFVSSAPARMKLLHQVSVAVLLLCLLAGSRGQQELQARQAVSNANNAFNTKLFQLLGRIPGNLFFSPLSVEAVLAMAWLGAGGDTARQLTAGLHLPESRRQVEVGFKELLTHLQSLNAEVTLDIANKIFAQQGSELYDSFQASTKRHFLAEAQEVEFKRAQEAARTINQWVEQKTRNRIQNLISPDSLDSNTLMVLVNAIYFKGKWLNQFEESETRPKPFYLDSRTRKNVPMMQLVNEFPYAELPQLKMKAIQLPYVGDHLSMVILLPDDIEGLAQLEAVLTGVDLAQVVNVLSTAEVAVSLPKFRLETTSELNNVLQELGMTAMFGTNANFTGIAKRNLAVSRVVQKAFVEVTEEGSEAAAATGVQIVALSGAVNPYHPKIFKADHPFLFVIREEDTGAVLFMGRYAVPSPTPAPSRKA